VWVDTLLGIEPWEEVGALMSYLLPLSFPDMPSANSQIMRLGGDKSWEQIGDIVPPLIKNFDF